MTISPVRRCQCPHCQQAAPHPDQLLHQQMNLLLSRLDEPQRRWFVALESNRVGHGGDRLLSQITGLDEQTMRRGRAELAEQLAQQPTPQLPQAGGGRPLVEKKTR